MSADLQTRVQGLFLGASVVAATDASEVDAGAATAAANVAAKQNGSTWKAVGILKARLTDPKSNVQDRLVWLVAYQQANPDGTIDAAAPLLVLIIDAKTQQLLGSQGS